MFFHSIFLEFLKFVAFYVIFKCVVQFINIEARRNSWHVPAGVSGILA